MLKTFKLEIKLSHKQIEQVKQDFCICRFLYNKFIEQNNRLYTMYKRGLLDANQKSFINGYTFDKYVNNNLSKKLSWIKNCTSKPRKQAIMNAEKAFINFFNKKSKFPRFKKKKDNNITLFHPKNGAYIFRYERHKLKVPNLGWIYFKEYGYLPKNKIIKSITLSTKANIYFVSILMDVENINDNQINVFSNGIGIDLGIKKLITLSNGKQYFNINKSNKIKKLKKKLKHLQRDLSRKYVVNKKEVKNPVTKSRKNIDKNILKIQKQYAKIHNMQEDYINKCISEIIKTKPKYITIEDLNVQGMMKNKHLSKAISECKFNSIKEKLRIKCKEYGIELRKVDRYYPSSKLCSSCGNKKKDLKLSDRQYICASCNFEEDRDINASINLANAKEYKVL